MTFAYTARAKSNRHAHTLACVGVNLRRRMTLKPPCAKLHIALSLHEMIFLEIAWSSQNLNIHAKSMQKRTPVLAKMPSEPYLPEGPSMSMLTPVFSAPFMPQMLRDKVPSKAL